VEIPSALRSRQHERCHASVQGQVFGFYGADNAAGVVELVGACREHKAAGEFEDARP